MEGMKIKRIAFEKLRISVCSHLEIQSLTLTSVLGTITTINDHTYNFRNVPKISFGYISLLTFAFNQFDFQEHKFAMTKRLISGTLHFQ